MPNIINELKIAIIFKIEILYNFIKFYIRFFQCSIKIFKKSFKILILLEYINLNYNNFFIDILIKQQLVF